MLDELRRGQELLSAAAHCKALVVLAEGADETVTEALEEAGYVCWQTTTDGRVLEGTAYSRATELMREMDGGEEARNYLLLDDSDGEMLTSLYLPSILPGEMPTHWLNFFIAVKLTPCRISVPFSGV